MEGKIYLPTARKQLEDIVDYIAVELAAPDAALDFIDEVDKAAKSLAEVPYRHPIYHTSFAVLEEVRWISVKNYNMFYKVFEEEKIYLNPKLNIVELSMSVGTNRTYISNYINQQLHTTFYEYVNKWRVKRAKELLSSTSLPLEDIATQSGFNSLSSFRRYFTKSMGTTPQAFRKE